MTALKAMLVSLVSLGSLGEKEGNISIIGSSPTVMTGHGKRETWRLTKLAARSWAQLSSHEAGAMLTGLLLAFGILAFGILKGCGTTM